MKYVHAPEQFVGMNFYKLCENYDVYISENLYYREKEVIRARWGVWKKQGMTREEYVEQYAGRPWQSIVNM